MTAGHRSCRSSSRIMSTVGNSIHIESNHFTCVVSSKLFMCTMTVDGV